jgi:hypothetical protein
MRMMVLDELRQLDELVAAQRVVLVRVELIEYLFRRWQRRAWWRTTGSARAAFARPAVAAVAIPAPVPSAATISSTPIPLGTVGPIAASDQVAHRFASRSPFLVAQFAVAVVVEGFEQSRAHFAAAGVITCRVLRLRWLGDREHRHRAGRYECQRRNESPHRFPLIC